MSPYEKASTSSLMVAQGQSMKQGDRKLLSTCKTPAGGQYHKMETQRSGSWPALNQSVKWMHNIIAKQHRHVCTMEKKTPLYKSMSTCQLSTSHVMMHGTPHQKNAESLILLHPLPGSTRWGISMGLNSENGLMQQHKYRRAFHLRDCGLME